MLKPILATSAAITIALGLLASPAAARDHSRYGWWESSVCGADPYDEYNYSGVRWYGDAGYRYTRYNDFGEGYGDSLEYGYDRDEAYDGDHGYRHRHQRRGGHGHHRRHHRGHGRH